MPGKCDFCGEKVKNGVCTGCGMDYNRSSADTAHERSDSSYDAFNNAEMFSKAIKKGSIAAQKRKRTITILLLSVLLIIITACVALIDTSEDAKRAADRKREQAITERAKLSIPKISIPEVNIPKITVPDADLGEDFQKALDHDIQAIIEQNEKNKE